MCYWEEIGFIQWMCPFLFASSCHLFESTKGRNNEMEIAWANNNPFEVDTNNIEADLHTGKVEPLKWQNEHHHLKRTTTTSQSCLKTSKGRNLRENEPEQANRVPHKKACNICSVLKGSVKFKICTE